MAKKSLIVYSSYTGNTEKVAVRLETAFARGGWHCDRVKIQKRAEDILHPKFDLGRIRLRLCGFGHPLASAL